MFFKINNQLYSGRFFLFILLIVIYSFSSNNDNISGAGLFSVSSLLKYGILSLCVIFELLAYFSKKKLTSDTLLLNNFKNFFYFFVIVSIISISLSIKSSEFSLRIIQNFIFVFIPMLYAFLVINTWNKSEIHTAFKLGLLISIIGYVYSTKIGILGILDNLSTINYQNTNSTVLESSTFALLSVGFAGFFCYFKKGYLWKFLSVLFVILTFKRQITLTAILLFILGFFNIRRKKVNIYIFIISGLVLMALAFAYYYAIEPQHIVEFSQILGVDLRSFSTNRTDRLNWLLNSDFKTYGFGSSTDYMYKTFGGFALEMDTVQLYVEMGGIGIIIFISSYLSFAKNNLYVYVFMCLLIVNSIFSSGMASTFAWIVILIGMALIMVENNDALKEDSHE
nr:hypothetical protein [Lactiplantibacillus plantarum]